MSISLIPTASNEPAARAVTAATAVPSRPCSKAAPIPMQTGVAAENTRFEASQAAVLPSSFNGSKELPNPKAEKNLWHMIASVIANAWSGSDVEPEARPSMQEWTRSAVSAANPATEAFLTTLDVKLRPVSEACDPAASTSLVFSPWP